MKRNRKGKDADGAGQPAGPKALIDGPDAILALVLIALCVLFYRVSAGFPEPGLFLGENVLPEHFPRLLLVAIGILALLVPFEHRLELDRWPLIRKARGAPIGASTFVTMGFLLILVGIGEWIGTILTIVLAAVGLPLLWGERRWLLVVPYALIFTGIVTYLFSIILSVYFEPGVFGLTLR